MKFSHLFSLILCIFCVMKTQALNAETIKSVSLPAEETELTTSKPESDEFVTKNGRHVVISFIKHGTLMIRVDDYTIHIDPVLMFATDYSKFPKADLLLVTHEHGDHFDKKAIQMLKKDGTVFISNSRVSELSGESTALSVGDIKDFGTLKLTATPAYNNSPDHKGFHPKGRDLGYILDIDGLRIYIAGDTEDIPEMKGFGEIDIAFLPVNQPYTMTPEQCKSAIMMISPKIIYPYHYGETDLSELVSFFKGNKKIDLRIRQMQ